MYDKRIDRANSELSKLIIGQTMTIEDGSSLSQSETHLSVFRNLIEEDCDMLRDVINTRLLPRMVAHGFPVEELTFNWDYSVDYTSEQMEVEILKDEKVLDFIDTHASVLDSTFEKVKMSDTMRSFLQQSNWVFSGMKTFHELKEAFPSLIDENGEKSPLNAFIMTFKGWTKRIIGITCARNITLSQPQPRWRRDGRNLKRTVTAISCSIAR